MKTCISCVSAHNRLTTWISNTFKGAAAFVSSAGAAALALGLLLPAGVHAGAMHWTGGYTGGNKSTWNNAANWVENVTYPAGSDVFFADSNINATPTTYLGLSRTVNSITFSNNCVAAFNVSFSTSQTATVGGATLTFLAGNAGVTVQAGDTFAHSLGYAGNPATGCDLILQDNLTVAHDGSANFTILRPITNPTGSFGVTKAGAGVLVLSGANSYSGNTIIMSGTLRLGANNVIPDGAGKGNVTVNGTLDMNTRTETINGLSGSGIVDNMSTTANATLTVGGNDQNSTFSGVIQNSGGFPLSLTKTGLGTLTLSGVNTHSGTNLINAGKLVGVVGGSAANSVVILNSATATLGISIPNNTLSWTYASLSNAAAGSLEFNFGSLTPSFSVAPLIITGYADFTAATPTVNIIGNNLALGTFPLMNWGSTAGTAPSAVTLPAGVTGHLSLSGNTLNLVITSLNTALAKANNTVNLNLPASWTTGVVPGSTTVAPWDNTVTSPNTTVLGADLSWAGIKIADPSGLVTINAGNTLTLGGAATAIDMSTASASLTLNCPVVVGGTSNVWNVAAGQTLTLGNTVSGASPVTMQGGGAAILAGANTFNGGLNLTTGTLNINSATALGTGTFTNSGGSIDNSSVGAITLVNNNPEVWNAAVNFLGSQSLNLGTGAVTLGANRTVTVNANTLTIGGAIGGGTYSLTKGGVGTLVLNGANSFNGGLTLNLGTLTLAGANTFTNTVTLNQGILNLNNPAALGTGTLNFITAGGIIDNTSGGALVLNNNPQAWNADFVFNGTANLDLGTGAVTFTNNRLVTVNANNLTVGGVIAGTNSLTKQGSGTMILNGANTFTGQMTVSSGLVKANTIANAGVASSLGAATAANSVILLGNSGGNGTLEYTGSSPASTDRQIQVGHSGNGSENAGIANNNADPANTLTFANPSFNAPATGGISSTGPRTLTLGGSNTGNNTVLGSLVNNAGTGAAINNIVNLTKTGSSTWVLAGANTYTGPTTVSNGTLRVNGSLAAASTVTVYTGGALGGTGTIKGVANINAGGTLAPGATVGTMTFANNLTFDPAAQAVLDCSANPVSGNDQVVLTSTSAALTGGGATITINQSAGANTLAPTDYLLFNLTGLSGSVSDFNSTPSWLPSAPANAANYSIATEGKQVYLKYTPVAGADILTIETAANGSGVLVSDQNVVAGTSITGYAIERTVGGTFVANATANWSLINLTGGVVGSDMVVSGDSKSATFTGHIVGTGQMRIGANGMASTTSGTLTVVAGTATQVRVETQPDGSGTLVPAQTLVSGNTVTGYAISRDAGGNFVANVAATWSLVNVTGNVVSGDLIPSGDTLSAGFTGNLPGAANIQAAVIGLTSVDSGLIAVTRNMTWYGGAGAPAWDTITANWYLPSFAMGNFVSGDDVIFDDNGAANPTVNLVGSLNPRSVTVAGSTSYTLGGSGKITGTASLTNNGAGITTIQTANDYSGMTLVNTGTLVLSGNNSAATNGTIVKAGAILQVGAANNFTAGTLTLAGGATAPTLNLLNDAATDFAKNVVLSGTNLYAINADNAVSGTAQTHKLGIISQATAQARTLTVASANSYGLSISNLNLDPGIGQTTTIAANTPVTLLDVSNPMSGFAAANFDTLTLDGTDTGSYVTGSIEDAAGGNQTAGGYTRVIKQGTGTWTLSGTNLYTGVTTVNAGTLKNGSATAFTGSSSSLTVAGTAVFDLNGFNASVASVAAGANTATITDNGGTSGTSTLTITNQANTSIATLINDGANRKVAVVVYSGNNTTPDFASGSANTFSGGFTLGYNGGVGTRCWNTALITGTPFGSGTITIGQAITDKAAFDFSATSSNNVITNNIVFNSAQGTDQAGHGIRSDGTNNTFSGTITAGLTNASFGGSGSVILTGQVTGNFGLQSDSAGFNLTLNNQTANANNYQGNTIINNATAVMTLGAAQQIPSGAGAGYVTNLGTLNLGGFSQTINGLAGSGKVDGVSGAPTFTVGGNNANGFNFSGVLQNTAGSLSLVKIGTGTQTFSGANTYTGNTTISNGTLVVSSAQTGGGNFTVEDGATLGVVRNATTTVLSANSLTLGTASGATSSFTLPSGNPAAQVITAGALTLNGVNAVAIAGAGFTAGQFPLIKYTTKAGSGSFATTPVSVPGGFTATVSNNVANASIDLVIASSIASNPTNISFTVTGNSLNLTWPADHLGWMLQSNSVSLAIPADWFDISNTVSGTSYSITMNPAQTNVFYRLRKP